MDMTSSISSYLNTDYANRATSAAAEKISSSISGITSSSSEEEVVEAVKSFETYMVEQVIKEVKETFAEDEDEDSTMSMYSDLFMDSAISDVASQLVDQIGGSITDDFVQQIMRNYGITGINSAQAEAATEDAADVSEEIANTKAATVTSVQA